MNKKDSSQGGLSCICGCESLYSSLDLTAEPAQDEVPKVPMTDLLCYSLIINKIDQFTVMLKLKICYEVFICYQ